MRWPIILVAIVSHFFNANGQEAAEIYAQFCAGCHGAKLEGGLSEPLIKDEWTYGRHKGDMIRNITFGIRDTEMIAWNTILDNGQIKALVDYIYEAQKTPPDEDRPLPPVIQTSSYALQVEVWQSNLTTPWGIEFASSELAFISERNGELHEIRNGMLNPVPVQGTPPTHTASSTGGYMDIALDPEFGDNGWIYLGYSHVGAGEEISDRMAPSLTKIIRGRVKDNQWLDQQTLFQAPDSLLVVRGNRWGCRLLFDPLGKLLFTIGDMGKGTDSQLLDKATGKIFRINADGSIPSDNPFLDTPKALPTIFTIGNRNVQGLAIHPETKEIWATEHGPMGGDELNIITPGSNYGWPLATFGVDYTGDIVSDQASLPGMKDPIYQWTPSNGICPLTFVTSPAFDHWQNHVIAGALAYEELLLLTLDGHNVLEEEKILKGFGRVRDVKFGPDGALYVVLNQPGRILRLTPE